MNPNVKDLISKGWCVRKTLRDKHPGVPSDVIGLTLEDDLEGDQFNVIIGSKKAPNRSGIIDIETDGPVGEEHLLRVCSSQIPQGPFMITPSGSIHRLFLWPTLPEGYQVNIRAGVLPKTDAPWQFLALDEDKRIWHNWELPVPPLPQGLYDIVVRSKKDTTVEIGGPFVGETGTNLAVQWIQKKQAGIKQAQEGIWNATFTRAVYGAAGLVAAGYLNEIFARTTLMNACEDPTEAKTVFEASWEAGFSNPWKLEGDHADPSSSDFLYDGGDLTEAVLLAPGCNSSSGPEKSPIEIAEDLKTRILVDLSAALYDEDLKTALRELPTWQVEGLVADIIAGAGYGQRTDTRNRMAALQRALRDRGANPPVGGGGGGAGNQGGHPNTSGRPDVLWNVEDQLNITEDIVKAAMDDYSGEAFYQAAPGQYVKVVEEDLVNLKEAGVKSMLSQMGHWRVVNGQRELGHIPTEASRMVTDPSWECKVPTIKRRVEVPFMLADGNIVSSPGFHEESGVFLLPRSNDRIIVPEVPSTVTDENVAEAKRIFDDAVEGFVFRNDASQTNLIAMTLTSPLRELFMSNPMVPLLTSTAPQSGSGKGTSIRVPLSTVGIGPQSLSTTAYNADENEFEKKLVGKLLKKSTYIFLDNIRQQVNSSVLEQMLTASHYDGRTLGYSEVNSLSTMVLWVSTLQSAGSFNRDLTRRCVPVELLKNYKGKWAHKNIESYLADMRGKLIWACFVVARKWMQDGGIISNARLDGYGGWTEVIGGMLERVLGYEGFLGNLVSFRRQQDEVAMTIDGILERWLDLYGEKELPARFAVEDFEDPSLHQLLSLSTNASPRQVIQALQRQLDGQRGHIVNNSHIWEPLGIKQIGPEGAKKHYKLVPLPEEEVY